MVVDAGGGTIDITVHRNRSGGGLVELHSPSGGMWGSSFINKKFEELLYELLGNDAITTAKGSPHWYSIMDTFEVFLLHISYLSLSSQCWKTLCTCTSTNYSLYQL